MNRPMPPQLSIPPTTSLSPVGASPAGASPAGSATQTGRPPLWTNSAQRKMSRLYVYTTLPLTKIIELIHHHPADVAPGYALLATYDSQFRSLI